MQPKLLIANRGEIACRVIRAAKGLGLRTVAVYSDADVGAPHVVEADEAVAIGPAAAAQSYLRQDALIEAARSTGASLVHPGYGFLAESASFAQSCSDAGLRFVGPSAEVIAAMGDKERARSIAIAAGVPVAPGTPKLPPDDAAIRADVIGYPLLVKAAAGGGGIGMRLVDRPEDLEAAVAATRTMAQRAFGDGSVYLERFVRRARHIEVQVFGFGDGRAIHLFERECSVQRRHQKVIEEALSPALDAERRRTICDVAVRLAQTCRYEGAGTVEFLYDDETGEFFFLEMNTRIQVEHPVTEMVTGVDLVQAQIRKALGEDLSSEISGERIAANGWAIEARVYAERPERNFIPSPGTISALDIPERSSIRIDTGYVAGMKVTPFYDPMLMKVIAHGTDRTQTIERLTEALRDLRIEGIATNRDFLCRLLESDDFRTGSIHTGWLSENIRSFV